ncbi:MAG TPA: glucokinase [Candidatus Acidoferrales bacterium]|nr:glucokinase [Candidatus Acidoferrales bacterium]
MILAGDIGATKTLLGWFAVSDGKLVKAAQERFPSKDYPGLEPMVAEFRRAHPETPEAACFGVAGPVIEDRVKAPNLPWTVERKFLTRALGTERLWLLNDLECSAYGILALDEKDFCVLNRGVVRAGSPFAIIAAGTGLGEAVMCGYGGAYHVLASEGGHADFAPRTPVEIELLRHLARKFGHVSYERVLSGPGLVNVYECLEASGRFEEPPWLKTRLAAEDPAAVISRAALAREAEICVAALDIFVSVYGAEAGNLALRAKALGGIYVGGGIAPKILAKLEDGSFMAAFTDKGRYREFAASIPVKVVLNEESALLGAASYAARRLRS